MTQSHSFAHAVITWAHDAGRHDLPWQQNRTRYRVWVSEIMLQQTQVATVIPYYERFMRDYPKVSDLAAASMDDVLAHWSGLGYYARGRNLHKAARLCVDEHNGDLPVTLDALMALPGIGRSTAGAILSLADNQSHPILDGNVKRVLARHYGVDGFPGKAQVLNTLWQLSEEQTPVNNARDYNQAMMDLGATLCTRSKPQCLICPITRTCVARQQGTPEKYPGKKPKKDLPVKTTHLLVLCDRARGVWLEQRPPSGIWGGLWSLPETTDAVADDHKQLTRTLQKYGLRCATKNRKPVPPNKLNAFRHTFSHYHLDITVLEVAVEAAPRAVMDCQQGVWYNGGQWPGGMAAPMKKIEPLLIASLNNRFIGINEPITNLPEITP